MERMLVLKGKGNWIAGDDRTTPFLFGNCNDVSRNE